MSDEPEPQPVGRFDWERLVDRAEMPKHLKALAYVLAHHADNDGSNVRPGTRILADILDDSERTVEMNRQTLVSLGFLKLVKRGGGRNGQGTVNVYRLTDPGPGFLIFRLDPDGNRLIERKAGKRPGRRIEPKPTSDESGVENPAPDDQGADIEPKPTSVENDFQPKRNEDPTEAHFGLPLLTTTPLLLTSGDHPQSDAARDVENPDEVTRDQVEPEPAAPTLGDLEFARASRVLKFLSPLERDLLLSAARERLTREGRPTDRRTLTVAAAALHEIKETA